MTDKKPIMQPGPDHHTVWVYRAPYDAVAEIKDHVAFYPDRVDSIVEKQPAAA
jgi:uncharacterized protein (DUF427 family)